MHAYEIYDAPDAALQDELQALDDRLAARAFSSVESEKAALYLRGLIEDELGERRQTMSIFDLLKDEFAIEMGIDVHAANEATLEVALTAAEWMSWAVAGPPTPSQRAAGPAAARDAPRSAPAQTAPAAATPLTPTTKIAPRTAGAAVGGSAGTPAAAPGVSGAALSDAGEECAVSAEPSSETAAADGASTKGTPKKAASQLKSLSVQEAARAMFLAEQKKVSKAKKARETEGWGFGAGPAASAQTKAAAAAAARKKVLGAGVPVMVGPSPVLSGGAAPSRPKVTKTVSDVGARPSGSGAAAAKTLQSAASEERAASSRAQPTAKPSTSASASQTKPSAGAASPAGVSRASSQRAPTSNQAKAAVAEPAETAQAASLLSAGAVKPPRSGHVTAVGPPAQRVTGSATASDAPPSAASSTSTSTAKPPAATAKPPPAGVPRGKSQPQQAVSAAAPSVSSSRPGDKATAATKGHPAPSASQPAPPAPAAVPSSSAPQHQPSSAPSPSAPQPPARTSSAISEEASGGLPGPVPAQLPAPLSAVPAPRSEDSGDDSDVPVEGIAAGEHRADDAGSDASMASDTDSDAPVRRPAAAAAPFTAFRGDSDDDDSLSESIEEEPSAVMAAPRGAMPSAVGAAALVAAQPGRQSSGAGSHGHGHGNYQSRVALSDSSRDSDDGGARRRLSDVSDMYDREGSEVEEEAMGMPRALKVIETAPEDDEDGPGALPTPLNAPHLAAYHLGVEPDPFSGWGDEEAGWRNERAVRRALNAGGGKEPGRGGEGAGHSGQAPPSEPPDEALLELDLETLVRRHNARVEDKARGREREERSKAAAAATAAPRAYDSGVGEAAAGGAATPATPLQQHGHGAATARSQASVAVYDRGSGAASPGGQPPGLGPAAAGAGRTAAMDGTSYNSLFGSFLSIFVSGSMAEERVSNANPYASRARELFSSFADRYSVWLRLLSRSGSAPEGARAATVADLGREWNAVQKQRSGRGKAGPVAATSTDAEAASLRRLDPGAVRVYKVRTTPDHPEVLEVVRAAVELLGRARGNRSGMAWIEDPEPYRYAEGEAGGREGAAAMEPDPMDPYGLRAVQDDGEEIGGQPSDYSTSSLALATPALRGALPPIPPHIRAQLMAGKNPASLAALAATGGPGGAAAAALSPSQPYPAMWNVLWSWSSRGVGQTTDLLTWQRVNHYPEARQLTRKDLLAKNLYRLQRVMGMGPGPAPASSPLSVMPTTFLLPQEYEAFSRAFHEGGAAMSDSNIWIMKPAALSRGRGIHLVTAITEVTFAEEYVAQQYIARPLLISGRKFDLRLYVLVTSFGPLEAFIYRQGFARFSYSQYDASNVRDLGVHLTNASVQKYNPRGTEGAPPGSGPGLPESVKGPGAVEGGSKIPLTRLWELMDEMRPGSKDLLWSRMVDCVTVALMAVQGKIPHHPACFELFGVDLIVDSDLKVWMLEVNPSPSMSLDTPLDRIVKPRLVADTLALVDPLPFDRARLAEELAARLNAKASKTFLDSVFGRTAEDKATMAAALHDVLQGRRPRQYGELPADLGLFERIAPSKRMQALMRQRRAPGGEGQGQGPSRPMTARAGPGRQAAGSYS